jgi:hypothetical protein
MRSELIVTSSGVNTQGFRRDARHAGHVINEWSFLASYTYRIVIALVNDIRCIQHLSTPAMIQASDTMPRQAALTTPHHPHGEAAATILCGSVDSVWEALWTRVELVNDGIADTIFYHSHVNAVLQVCTVTRKLTHARMTHQACYKPHWKFTQVDHSEGLLEGQSPFWRSAF